jgi:hypothetical protein
MEEISEPINSSIFITFNINLIFIIVIYSS